MKKLLFSIFLGAIAISLYAQPVVYFNFLSHNEETNQWNGTPYYTANRAKIITLANYFQDNGITWNMQSDWVYLTNVLSKETAPMMSSTNNKNILRFLYEDKGVEMDPHAHESTYIYPDVVALMDSIGLPESKIIGGTIYNDFNGMNVWTNLINGQYGVIFPTKFWKPDFMMGGGTPNHVADIKYYGLWNPTDTNDYLTHNPASPLHHIGVGCEMKIRDTSNVAYIVAALKQVVSNVQNGSYPSNGIYLQTIFFEQGDLNNMTFYNKVIEIADSVNQMVQSGTAQWKTLKQVGDYWINTYNSQMFQWECGQITTGIDNRDDINSFTLYPNPTQDVLFIESPSPLTEVSLFNILGEEKRHIKGNPSSIDISNLANGLYFVQLSTDKSNLTYKIIKQ